MSIRKYYNSYLTILRIISDRGYTISNEIKEITIEDFRNNLQDDMPDDLIITDKKNNRTVIAFWRKNINRDTLLSIAKILEAEAKSRNEKHSFEAIIITEKESTTNNATLTAMQQNYKVSIYHISETQIYILDSVYVSKHKLCSEEEKTELFKDYAIKRPSEMPQIRYTEDPIVRHFGAQRGDVFKIERVSETDSSHTEITYRIVI